MKIRRSLTHWEKPELWTRGGRKLIVRAQGLSLDIGSTMYSYIPIGKNASTFMEEFLPQLGKPLTSYNYNNPPPFSWPKKFIVVLRDPFERWCSGIVEYLVNSQMYREGENTPWALEHRETLDLIMGHLTFDRHTCPQLDYLDGLTHEQCIFFRLDENFENTIRKFAEKELNVPTNDVVIRERMYNTSQRETHKELRKLISMEGTSGRYHSHIQNTFLDDSTLYNSANYYE